MVKAVGASLGVILELAEDVRAYNSRPVMMRTFGMASKADSMRSRPVDIETKSQEITATVSMSFSII